MGPALGRAAGSQCGGHSPSRDRAGPLGNAVPRPGRRASRPRHSKRLVAAAGTLGSSLSPKRRDAEARGRADPTAGSPTALLAAHRELTRR